MRQAAGMYTATSGFPLYLRTSAGFTIPPPMSSYYSSRSSYPTFLSLQDTIWLQLGFAARGLVDAFRWDVVFKLVTRLVKHFRNVLDVSSQEYKLCAVMQKYVQMYSSHYCLIPWLSCRFISSIFSWSHLPKEKVRLNGYIGMLDGSIKYSGYYQCSVFPFIWMYVFDPRINRVCVLRHSKHFRTWRVHYHLTRRIQAFSFFRIDKCPLNSRVHGVLS